MNNNAAQDATQAIAAFLRQRVFPLERDMLEGKYTHVEKKLHVLRSELRSRGWWGLGHPEEAGGQPLALAEFGQMSEVLGSTPLGHLLFNVQAPDIGNMELLAHAGNSEQKERFLLPLARGEIRSCFAMTEPEHAGSNPAWMSTTARTESGDFVLEGHKWFTSSAEGADFAIVMAMTRPEREKPHHRFSMILVPLDTPGFRIVRNLPVMGESGQGYFSHAEVRLENCRVPQSSLLGEEGAGFRLAQTRLGPGRIHHCMRWVGICQRALEMMIARAQSRELAPGKTLADQQSIQQAIAKSRLEIHAARLMVLDAARKIDAEGAANARVEISMIKYAVARTLGKVLDRAIQIHGGLGLLDDLMLAWWYRHERAARIYDGPDEVHLNLIARETLRSTK